MNINTEQLNITKEENQKIQNEQKQWLDLLKKQGESAIVARIEQIKTEKILEQDTYQELKNLLSNSSNLSYLRQFRQSVKRCVDLSELQDKGEGFDINQYIDKEKTEIAGEMADYVVYESDIRPVDIGTLQKETKLWEYKPAINIWRPFSNNRIDRLAYRMAGLDVASTHLRREFKNKIRKHPDNWHETDLGTKKTKILEDSGKIIDLSKIQEKKVNELDTREAEKEDRAKHKVNVEYNPDASEPIMFKDFINTLLDGKQKQIKTLQEWLGYTLKFPCKEHQKALIILGVSNSGKSALAEMLENLFTKHSTSTVSFPQLGYDKRYHIHKLNDSILNIEKDLSFQNIKDTSTIKQVISQEKLNVEPKKENAFEVDPDAKHLVCANVAPSVDHASDDAFYNRFLTLKAPNAVPKEDQINNLGEKLVKREGEEILLWMLKGLKRLEENKDFTLSPSPTETKRMWNEYGDSSSRFLWQKAELTGEPGDKISTEKLYEIYEKWMEDKTMKKYTRYKFTEKVQKQPQVWKENAMYDGAQRKCFLGIDIEDDLI